MNVQKRMGVSIALLLATTACADSRISAPSPGPTSFPARMLVLSGDGQVGIVDEELKDALVVSVVDSSNAPIVGQVVNFRVVAGGGHVFAGTAITDRNGRAAERWTLGTNSLEIQRIEARAVDPVTGERRVFAAFVATASAGAPAKLKIVTPDSQSALLGRAVEAPPTVQVTDRFGNPARSAPVRFMITAGGGILSDSLVLSDSTGHAAVREWRVGSTAGRNVLRASLGDSLFSTFVATAVSPPSVPTLALSTSSVIFSVVAASGPSAFQSVGVSNSGGGVITGLAGGIAYPSGQPAGWLEGAFDELTAPTNVRLRVNPGTLPPGTYGAVVEISSAGVASSPQHISVTMVVLPTSGGSNVCSVVAGASIVADDGTFLGVIGGKYATNSIFNEYGNYGSKYSRTSIFNDYGTYGGQYSAQSPFNPYASRPPILYVGGQALAYLTVNTSKSPRIDPRSLSSCSFN